MVQVEAVAVVVGQGDVGCISAASAEVSRGEDLLAVDLAAAVSAEAALVAEVLAFNPAPLHRKTPFINHLQ